MVAGLLWSIANERTAPPSGPLLLHLFKLSGFSSARADEIEPESDCPIDAARLVEVKGTAIPITKPTSASTKLHSCRVLFLWFFIRPVFSCESGINLD